MGPRERHIRKRSALARVDSRRQCKWALTTEAPSASRDTAYVQRVRLSNTPRSRHEVVSWPTAQTQHLQRKTYTEIEEGETPPPLTPGERLDCPVIPRKPPQGRGKKKENLCFSVPEGDGPSCHVFFVYMIS